MSVTSPFGETPPHLQEAIDLDKAQEKLEAATTVAKLPVFDPNDPKAKEAYKFDFEWNDRAGRSFKGTFTSNILSLAQQSAAGAMQAYLSRNIPYDQLDPVTKEINFLLTRLHHTLAKEGRPPWAVDLSTIKSLALLQALYAEVAAHEATFHGYTTTSG